MTRNTKTLLVILVIVCLSGAWGAGLVAFVADAAKPPPIETPQLDAIVALTGGSNRLDTGFDLLEQGAGKKLFISGVYRGTEINTLLKLWRSEPQASLDCCVTLGFTADDTVGNARETLAWLEQEGFTSFYLVTSNYHMRRAMLEFQLANPTLTIIPYPVSPGQLDLDIWWEDPAMRWLIVREYTKYLAAYVFHGLLGFRRDE